MEMKQMLIDSSSLGEVVFLVCYIIPSTFLTALLLSQFLPPGH